MKNIDMKEINDLMIRIKCPKNFICVKSNFECLCKAKDMGFKNFLECREKDPLICSFALSFGHAYVCKCPIRIYIAKEMNK